MGAIDDLLDVETIRRIDQACDRFEHSLRSGRPGDLASVSEGWEAPERASLVRELVLIDLHYAARLGEPRDRQYYHSLFPDEEEAIDAALAGAALDPTSATSVHSQQTPAERTAAAAGDATLPETIGRYRVVRQLGGGGFGVVDLARDPDLNRPVAIKRPKSAPCGSESEWQLLRREAELAARVKHPGVVAIYDIGRDEAGRPYFVMELVEGESLQHRLRRGPIKFAEAVRLAIAVCDAVEHIHQSGLVHRDLKPGNILVDARGQPKVADLGLAVGTGGGHEHLAGTYAYMAPEQLLAEKSRLAGMEVDHRCDIWALGVILYEMLAGRRPFASDDRTELARQIVHDAPAGLDGLDGQTRPLAERICMTCLAKRPEARYASAAALADTLREAQRRAPPARSRQRRAAIGACLVAVLAAAAAVWPIRGRHPGSASSTVAPPDVGSINKATASSHPFVIQHSGERFTDLQSAADAATDGAIIEVDADGPIALDQVNLGESRVTLRAARGRRPTLAAADDNQRYLLRTAGTLVVEDLELRRDLPRFAAARNQPSVLAVDPGGSLLVKRCRIIVHATSGVRAPCIRAGAGACEVRDSELHHPYGAAVNWAPRGAAELSFENCVADVKSLVVFLGGLGGEATVRLHRCSVTARDVVTALGAASQTPEPAMTMKPEQCYFDVDVVLRPILPFGGGEAPLSATDSLSWEGKQNVFAVRHTFLRCTMGRESMSLDIDDIADWNDFWGAHSGSIEIRSAEARGAPEPFDESIPHSGRLAWAVPDALLPAGLAAGADISSVGPAASRQLQ